MGFRTRSTSWHIYVNIGVERGRQLNKRSLIVISHWTTCIRCLLVENRMMAGIEEWNQLVLMNWYEEGQFSEFAMPLQTSNVYVYTGMPIVRNDTVVQPQNWYCATILWSSKAILFSDVTSTRYIYAYDSRLPLTNWLDENCIFVWTRKGSDYE